jgi:DNA replication protein
MVNIRQGGTVKKYKKGNITAAFGTDLFTHGSTAIPNLLLKMYRHLGISDTEMMLLIQLFRLRTEEKIYLPNPSLLTELLSGNEEQITGDLESLLHKELLKITDFFDAEQNLVIKGYDFEPLFEKLSEVWACTKVKENEIIKKLLTDGSIDSNKALNLYTSFENEFGRPLSPMEVEQIKIWSQKMSPVMVLEALRRAVLMGKHNFKYIDGILLEWEKNNIRTPANIEEYDRKFKTKQSNKPGAGARLHNDKKSDKKSLIQSLYMS